MLDFIRMIAASIVVFGILVFIHEMGHYLAARYCKIKVDVFSIGFGSAIKGWYDKLGTEWRLSVFPLGGYVRLHGFEKPDDPEELAKIVSDRAFYEKSVLQKMLVVSMGPIFNFLLAILLYAFIFAFVGAPKSTPDVVSVQAGSPAAEAGIKAGDHILKIDGKNVVSLEQLQKVILGHSETALSLGIQREGKEENISIQPKLIKENGHEIARIGVAFSAVSGYGEPVSIYKVIPMAVQQTWETTENVLSGIGQILTGKRSASELGGTIRIVQMSGQVASYGFVSLLSFMASLSVNLGLLNLLPIPALDGGRLVFYAVEGILGRSIPDRIRDVYLQIGISLILFLFLLSTYNDLKGIGVFGWVYKTFASISH
ncbi:RIP metalloprotease RseP [Acetobacteraceae bacterium]|nr:RIP metalloprotease RseP [Acetobacteraceae bacterium]